MTTHPLSLDVVLHIVVYCGTLLPTRDERSVDCAHDSRKVPDRQADCRVAATLRGDGSTAHPIQADRRTPSWPIVSRNRASDTRLSGQPEVTHKTDRPLSTTSKVLLKGRNHTTMPFKETLMRFPEGMLCRSALYCTQARAKRQEKRAGGVQEGRKDMSPDIGGCHS